MERCVPSKTKDVNSKLFIMITWTNEPKKLVKHISFDYKSISDMKKMKKW